MARAQTKGLTEKDVIVQPARRLEVPLYLSLSNWSLFFIKDAYSKKASSPTKQGEIMAMGIPIICNDIGDTGEIIKSSNAGIVVNDLSLASYQQAIAQLPNCDNLLKEDIRQAAFRYYDLSNGTKLYKEVYEQVSLNKTKNDSSEN
ncbi:MAG: hypothetical protein EOO85_33305 [Pedobacter sp.]|nr:MAG: hypothetical protein EOO85_33305 [Pedobacter sp.]